MPMVHVLFRYILVGLQKGRATFKALDISFTFEKLHLYLPICSDNSNMKNGLALYTVDTASQLMNNKSLNVL